MYEGAIFSNIFLAFKTCCVVILLCVTYHMFCFIQHVRCIKRAFKDAPGLKEKHWLFGTFAKMPMEPHARYLAFIDMANTHGSEKGYCILWGMFWKPFIVTCSPRLMAAICKSSEPKPRGFMGVYGVLLSWLGEGLLNANGDKWARNRRLLTPAFHFDVLKSYVPVYNDAAQTLINKISAHEERSERFELFDNVALCTLEVILKCAFSSNKDVQNQGEQNEYVAAVHRISDSFVVRFIRPYLFYDCLFYLTEAGKQYKKDCDFVHREAEELIRLRQETMETEDSQTDRKYLDFLDILLTAKDENGVGLSPLEIRNEVDTFLFEGHDTTASAISWILFSLAENPEYQRKCQAEIDEVLRDRENNDILWSDLSQFPYLTMCIKEGMRLHSPVPIVARETTKDFDIGDRVIPMGCIVQLNILALHHMENVWGSDHMEFIPERFNKENVAKMDPYQFVPFSAGSRNCIGQHFAMNEEKVVIARLLRQFTFTLDKDHVVKKKIAAVMRTNGIYMFAKTRRQNSS